MSKFANVSTALALVLGAFGTSAIAHADQATGGESIIFTGEDSGSSRGEGGGDGPAWGRRARRWPPGRALAAAVIGEDSGSWYLSQTFSPAMRTRAEVAREVAQSRASGELGAPVGEGSGSARVSVAMPAHWMRYVGPNIGNEFSLEPQLERHFV
ncbi:MAG: hypothetical protein U5L05_16495 [Rubrivivax sp.]|nr:hypothetical protein [Rubrivivax sp.]